MVGGNKREAWNAYFRNGGFPYAASITVESYLDALTSAFILYKVGRYDVKGKQHLKSLEKYYIVDLSLRHLLLGDKNADIGHSLENVVYLELLRRGYIINIGKMDDKEIDFIAVKGSDKVYYQVAASILDPLTFEREMSPLKKVPDHYPKYILSIYSPTRSVIITPMAWAPASG